jgi:hypothetical protein
VLFNLARDKSDGQFQVSYPDGIYTVGKDSDQDHTLEVLSTLTQLIGLNRSAKDLTKTPTVQVVP